MTDKLMKGTRRASFQKKHILQIVTIQYMTLHTFINLGSEQKSGIWKRDVAIQIHVWSLNRKKKSDVKNDINHNSLLLPNYQDLFWLYSTQINLPLLLTEKKNKYEVAINSIKVSFQ